MSDLAASTDLDVFVRKELVPERAAPIKTTGFVGFLRTRLFNSPTNILITIVSALLLWFTIIPLVKFLLIDAVWSGKDRSACLAENAGHVVGACWPYIQAKFTQFIYGFYPEQERWRVLTCQPVLAEGWMLGAHEPVVDGAQLGPQIVDAPRPRIAKPQCWDQM